MITIKTLLQRYQMGEVTPRQFFGELLQKIHHVKNDCAWIAIASDDQIQKK